MSDEIDRLFPEQSNRSQEYNYYEKLKRRAILTAQDTIAGDQRNQQEIDKINKWISSQIKPKDMIKAETDMIRSFEELCLMIQKNGNVKAKEMTVVEFFTMISLIKKKSI